MNPGAIKTIAYFDLILAIVRITKARGSQMGFNFFNVGVPFDWIQAGLAFLLISVDDYVLIGVARLYAWVMSLRTVASLLLDAFVGFANIYRGAKNCTFLVGSLFLVFCSYYVAVLTLVFKLIRNSEITNSSLQSTEG